MIHITVTVSLPSYVGGLYIEREDETLKIKRREQDLEINYPVLSSKEIKLAAIYLKKNSQQAHDRPILETIEILSQINDLWIDPNYDLRKESEDVLTILTGQSKQLIDYELDQIIDLFKKENLIHFLTEQFGDLNYLDDWVLKGDILLHAQPRGLILHSLAGNSFILGPLSLLYGILTKNINIAKLASSEPYFSVRFVQSINNVDKKLAKEMGVMYWKGKEKEIYNFLFDEELVDVVMAWGGLTSIRELKKISAYYGVKFIEHGPKFSFSIITEDILKDREYLSSIAKEIAKDIVIWNQYACCSPRIIFVQEKEKLELQDKNHDLRNEIVNSMQNINGRIKINKQDLKPEYDSKLFTLISESMDQLRKTITYNSALGFATLLSLELNEVSKKLARINMTEAEAIDTLNKRDYYTFNIESKGWGKIFVPTDSGLTQNTDWTILYLRKMPINSDLDVCVNRFVIITQFRKLEEIIKWIEKIQIKRYIQTFSIYSEMEKTKSFADKLTLLGACTITLPGEMNIHKYSAPHDGAYDLKELVRWVSINFNEKI